MDEQLIGKVRQHHCLYNLQSPDYRDPNVRQTAWEEIGRELNIPGNKAKETWEKLRRCFCNARHRRRQETRSGVASKKKSFWKYEEQMAFLLPFLDTRKTHSNLNESNNQKDIASIVNLDEEGAQSHLTASAETASNDKDRYETMRRVQNKKILTTPADQMVAINKENAALRKRKHEEKIKGFHSCPTTNVGTLDDIDMFFLSMSRMTKQLPKLEQARIKLEVSNSVLSAEMRTYQQISSTPHSAQSREQSFSPSLSPNVSVSMTSSSDYSNREDEEKTNTV